METFSIENKGRVKNGLDIELTGHNIMQYASSHLAIKRGISTCLYHFLYRLLSVHVHSAALRGASVHAYIISYIDDSQFMSIQHP
jgi:hypothetical protein